MRTADICPTCATYINALCVIYNGVYLSTIDVEPLDSLEVALGKINTFLGTIQPSLGFTPENVANKSTDITLGGATPSDVLYPSQKAVKNYVDAAISASSFTTVKVSLTSADILALDFSAPFTLIAAPGAGKFINVQSIYFKLNFGTTPYSNVTIAVNLGPITGVVSGMSALLDASVDTFHTGGVYPSSSPIASPVANTALEITTSAPPTGGDGTLDVYITYNVISL